MADKLSLSRRWERYNPSKTVLLWACVCCVVATMIIGFNWGGWVTGGTAASMAKSAGDSARAEMAAASCVTRFGAGPDNVAQLAALRKATGFQRSDLLRKNGWTTMPGSTEPVTGAAEICAQLLTTVPVDKGAPVQIKG